MHEQRADGRWSTRRVVVVLVAAGTAYVLALSGLFGVLAWRGASWVDALGSSTNVPTAEPSAPAQAPTPSPSPEAGGSEAPPVGPITQAQAVAALKSYDVRNAAAIRAQTRKAWAGVDAGPILADDLWQSTGRAAAKKAGHPFSEPQLPTTTLVRLLGSGTTGDGQWFAAVVRFGLGTDADTFVGIYERSGTSGPFRLRTQDLIDPAAVGPTGDPSSWPGTPPTGQDAIAPFVRYLTTDTDPAGLAVDSAVEGFLWSAPAAVGRIDYTCGSRPQIGPAAVPLTSGLLQVADITCRRSSTAASGQTFTYNGIDAAIKGGTPPLTALDCPVTVSAVFVARPDGGTDVIATYIHQTAPCSGTEGAPPGSA